MPIEPMTGLYAHVAHQFSVDTVHAVARCHGGLKDRALCDELSVSGGNRWETTDPVNCPGCCEVLRQLTSNARWAQLGEAARSFVAAHEANHDVDHYYQLLLLAVLALGNERRPDIHLPERA